MNIERKIINITATCMCIDPKRINMGTQFEDDLGCDSLDVVDLVMQVEIAFGIMIPDNHTDTFTTVADLVNYVGTAMECKAQAVS